MAQNSTNDEAANLAASTSAPTQQNQAPAAEQRPQTAAPQALPVASSTQAAVGGLSVDPSSQVTPTAQSNAAQASAQKQMPASTVTVLAGASQPPTQAGAQPLATSQTLANNPVQSQQQQPVQQQGSNPAPATQQRSPTKAEAIPKAPFKMTTVRPNTPAAASKPSLAHDDDQKKAMGQPTSQQQPPVVVNLQLGQQAPAHVPSSTLQQPTVSQATTTIKPSPQQQAAQVAPTSAQSRPPVSQLSAGPNQAADHQAQSVQMPPLQPAASIPGANPVTQQVQQETASSQQQPQQPTTVIFNTKAVAPSHAQGSVVKTQQLNALTAPADMPESQQQQAPTIPVGASIKPIRQKNTNKSQSGQQRNQQHQGMTPQQIRAQHQQMQQQMAVQQQQQQQAAAQGNPRSNNVQPPQLPLPAIGGGSSSQQQPQQSMMAPPSSSNHQHQITSSSQPQAASSQQQPQQQVPNMITSQQAAKQVAYYQQSMLQIEHQIQAYKAQFLTTDRQLNQAKNNPNDPGQKEIAKKLDMQKQQLFNEVQELRTKYKQCQQRILNLQQAAQQSQSAQQPSTQQSSSHHNAAAIQQHYQQQQQSVDTNKDRQNYQAVKYFHFQEQRTAFIQDQMRNSKYCTMDDESLKKRAAYLAASQVRMQINYDEQVMRRDATIDYKMETKMINGQAFSDLNRQNVQAASQQNQGSSSANPANGKANQIGKSQIKNPVSVSLPSKQWDNVRNFRPFLESATPDEKLSLLQKTLLKPRKRLRKLMDKRDKLVATKLAQAKKNNAPQASAVLGGQNAAAMGPNQVGLAPGVSPMGGADPFSSLAGGAMGVSGSDPILGGQAQLQNNVAGGIKAQESTPATATMIKCPVYKCPSKFTSNVDLDSHYQESHKELIALGISLGQDQEGQLKGCVKDTLLTSLITFAITNKDQFRIFQSDYQEDEANAVRGEIRDMLRNEM